MSQDQFGVLRTAKMAIEEGLIDQADFDVIKIAFLKAQQIKAGMDAGFLREEDYIQARDAFLHSLDFRVAAHGPAHAAPAAPQPAAPASYPGSPKVATSQFARTAQQPSNLSSQQAPPAAAARAPPPAAPPISIARTNSGSLNSSAPGSARAAQVSGGGAPPAPGVLVPGAVPVPTDLPKLGRMGAWMGKRSMSGISLNDNAVNLFNYIKSKSSYKWITYKIDDAGVEVVVDQLGGPDSTYEQFVSALPDGLCRYGVFDYAYSNADTQQTINKLVFVSWAPEGASTKAKMMYASTKDFFKGFLDGVGAELQANDYSELTDAEMRERVHLALTRK